MPIIDAQVHAYERDHPGRPWTTGVVRGPPQVTGDELIAAMDAAGVDGAILVSPFGLYGYDASYAAKVRAAHPGRVALVKPVDPADPGVAEVIADWAAQDGAVGVRLMLQKDAATDPADPGLNRVLAAAARRGLPVNLHCWGRLQQAQALIARNPDTLVVVDHLGLEQPFYPPPLEAPFAELPRLLRLADLDNVRLKLTGACTLSREAYPYDDIWTPLGRILDAFGLERCLWGTDWTRAVALLTYQQGVDAFRLSDRLTAADRARLMGGTLAQVYGWAPERVR